MKIRLLSLPLLLMLVASLAACGGGSQSVPANAIAVVNGTPITTAEFNTFFAQAVSVAKANHQPEPKPGTPQYTATRNQVVAFLVQTTELEQQAPKEGVTVTDADVTKFLTDLAKTNFNGSMAKLTDALKTQGYTMDAARRQVRITLLQQKIQKKVTANATVTTVEEKDYYNTNIAQYQTPAETTRSVEHILVKTKSLADKIEQRLKNGESFAQLAKKYSKDPGSAAQGGKYTATDGKEVPAYDKAAFALRTGELSAPVDATSATNGSYGWFIIKALAPVKKVAAHTTTFEQAEPTIKQQVLQQQQEKLWEKWVSDLQKQYEGKVSYQSSYAPPPTTALSTTPTG